MRAPRKHAACAREDGVTDDQREEPVARGARRLAATAAGGEPSLGGGPRDQWRTHLSGVVVGEAEAVMLDCGVTGVAG